MQALVCLSHRASRYRNWGSKPGCLIPESVSFTLCSTVSIYNLFSIISIIKFTQLFLPGEIKKDVAFELDLDLTIVGSFLTASSTGPKKKKNDF